MKPRILVVDDSEIVLQWTRIALGHDYDVITRNDPVGTGAAVVREHPDLVLLDIDMPLVQGDELVSSLKRSEAGKQTLVALYSSMAPGDLQAKMAACGADAVVPKTNDRQLLLERIRETLAKRDPALRSVRSPPATRAPGDLPAEARLALVAGQKTLSTAERELLGMERLLSAASISEAREVLGRGLPRLVILSPDLAGLETLSFCQSLRAERPTRKLPILWIDGSDRLGAAERAESAGANVVLTRPFVPTQLKQAVLKLVNVAPRCQVRMLVRTRRLGASGPFCDGFSHNLSTSGMLLETEEPVDVGDFIDVRFFVPGAGTEVVTDARVVRHHVQPSGRRVVGVQFAQLAKSCQNGIALFVERDAAVRQLH